MASIRSRLASIAAAAALIALSAGPALAGDPVRPAIDLSKLESTLSILHDGNGHYIVVGDWAHNKQLFWGDGSTFYKQRWAGGNDNDKTKVMYFRFWSPRDSRSRLTRTDKSWKLECSDRTTELQILAKGEAKKIFAHATFYSYYWQRQPYALHRDAHGRYYYVDRLRDDDYDASDFRLFIGRKGHLEQVELTNAVTDSATDVFTTNKGELRMAIDNARPATWTHGDRERVLDDSYPSAKLIFRDLGLYSGALGVPCDAL